MSFSMHTQFSATGVIAREVRGESLMLALLLNTSIRRNVNARFTTLVRLAINQLTVRAGIELNLSGEYSSAELMELH